jgi:hypothetical protein
MKTALRERRPSFEEVLDAYVADQIRPFAGSDSIYVTTCASAHLCLRRAVLDVKYRLFAQERTVEDSRGMLMGNFIESYFGQVLASKGYFLPVTGAQKSLTDGAVPHRLSGKVDFLDYDGYPVEIKAPHPYSMKEYQRLHDEGESLKQSRNPWPQTYYNQVQLYLALGDWPEGTLVAVARDELRCLEFRIPRDPERIDKLMETAGTIRAHCARIGDAARQTGRVTSPEVLALLPDPPGPDAWMEPPCGTCRYQHLCDRERAFAPVDYSAVRDTNLADALAVADEHKPAGKAWQDADGVIKDRIKLYMANYEGEKEVTLLTRNGGRLTIKRHGRGFRYDFAPPPVPLTSTPAADPVPEAPTEPDSDLDFLDNTQAFEDL